MRTLLALIFCLLSFQVFGLESNSTAIVRGRLNSNMDANGHSITNVYQIIDTNGNILGTGSGNFSGNANQFGTDASGNTILKSGALVTNTVFRNGTTLANPSASFVSPATGVGIIIGTASGNQVISNSVTLDKITFNDGLQLQKQGGNVATITETTSTGTVTASNFVGALTGDGAAMTNIPLANLTGLFTNRVLYVDTNGTTGVKGFRDKPYPSLTNAIANAVAGDTLWLTPGQVFDCGIDARTLSNITVVAYGATLTVSNGPNVLFTIKGPLDWFGGTIRDLGVATDASAILFPFRVAGTTAFTNNFHNLIIRSRTDAFNIDTGSAAFAPTINIFGCDWEDMWDLFTCSSPQTHRCKINAVGSRFAAIASLHTGSFGAGASIASAGTGYDFVFTGCDLICSNSTATCYGLLCDVNSTFTLSGTSCAFDTTAADSEQLFSGDNYAITVDGHPYPESYVVAGSGLVLWKGDATNLFQEGGAISSRGNGDRYWTAPVVTNGNSWLVTVSNIWRFKDSSGNQAQIANGRYTSDPGSTAGYSNFVAGSSANNLGAGVGSAAIGGGHANSHAGTGAYGVIGGGQQNTNKSGWSFIGGGQSNLVALTQGFQVIGGGAQNLIGPYGLSADPTFIGGGTLNVASNSSGVVIIGGTRNFVDKGSGAAAYNSVVLGGIDNTNTASYATVAGGRQNTAGADYTWVGGRQANAAHQGAFVWADSQALAFSSAANDEFAVRAQGGALLELGTSTFTNRGAMQVTNSFVVGTNGPIHSTNVFQGATPLNRKLFELTTDDKVFVNGAATFTGSITNTPLTASQLAGTDANKKLISITPSAASALQVSGTGLIPLSTEVLTNGATQNTAWGGGLTNNSAAGFYGNGTSLTNCSHAIVSGGSGTALAQVAATAGYTRFGAFGDTTQGSAATHQWKVPISGIWTNFWLNDDTGIGSGTNFIAFIVTNSVSTGFNISINGAGAGTRFDGSNLTYSVYIAAGTSVSLGCSNNASQNPVSQILSWSAEVRQ